MMITLICLLNNMQMYIVLVTNKFFHNNYHGIGVTIRCDTAITGHCLTIFGKFFHCEQHLSSVMAGEWIK